jgi:crotonobetainyl-CoA:carnitine CoA-transferase CaiB-like acyl-CoA transferase
LKLADRQGLETMTAKPLSGLQVLDMSQGIAGPSCGGHFAEFGAEVIKIEPPGGDWMRPIGTMIAGSSPSALVYNRGKRSLALDIRTPKGREIALKLAERSGVVIENARPGVMDRLGLGFESVRLRRPDVVYVSVSGWGQRGPEREKPMVDAVAQAFSGLMGATRSREGAPVKLDATLIDAITGLYAFQAATMALWNRAPGAPARHLDISLLQCAAHIQAPNIVEASHLGRPPGLLNPPAGNYRTADGWIVLSLVTEAQFQALCRVIGRPELAKEPRFESFTSRRSQLASLREIFDAAFASRKTSELVEAILAEGGLAGPINTYSDWLAHPHVAAVAAAPVHDIGGHPVAIPHLPGQPPNAAALPEVGEHSRDVLAGLGISAEEIARLVAEGIVTTKPSA